MCAYDTTLADALNDDSQAPACLRRNLLDSPYFPRTSRSTLAAVMALCAVFFFTSVNRLNHTDLWSHLNFGRWIVENGRLPTADPFSADASSQPMLNVPWLSQVGGYLVYQIAGPEGLALGHAALVALACGICMIAIRSRGAALGWAVAGGSLVFVLSLPAAGTIRPQLFGMVGAALVLLACSQLRDRRIVLLWLPLLMAVWANLHGSFAIGLAILGCYSLGETWSAYRDHRSLEGMKQDARLTRAWLAVALAVFGACLNPLGPKLLAAVASFGSNAALQQITEWRSLEIGSLSGVLFFSSLAMTGVLLRISPRRIEAYEVLLILLMAVATLSAIRMLTWWAIVWPWVAAPHAAAAWSKFRKAKVVLSNTEVDAGAPMRTAIAMGMVFMTLLLAPPSHALISGQPRGIGALVSTDTPLYVADEMERRGLVGRIYAPIDWADYLVWSRQGQVQPLAYSHVHALSPSAWRHYVRLAAGEGDWLETARQRQLDYLVVSKRRNPRLKDAVWAASRRSQPAARIIYQDQQCMLVQILPAPAEAAESGAAS